MKNKKILIVEDQERVARDISKVLENLTGYEVIGTLGSQREFEIKAHNIKPDLIIMDLYLPEREGGTVDYSIMSLRGLKIGNKYKQEHPEVGMLFTTHLPSDNVIETIRNNDAKGGLGFLYKNSSDTVMIAAIKEISNGRNYFDDYEFSRNNSRDKLNNKILELFTKNQKATLCGIAEGLSDEEIGKKIFRDIRSVRGYKKAIKEILEDNQICIGNHKKEKEYTDVDLANLALKLGLNNLSLLEKLDKQNE